MPASVQLEYLALLSVTLTAGAAIPDNDGLSQGWSGTLLLPLLHLHSHTEAADASAAVLHQLLERLDIAPGGPSMVCTAVLGPLFSMLPSPNHEG